MAKFARALQHLERKINSFEGERPRIFGKEIQIERRIGRNNQIIRDIGKTIGTIDLGIRAGIINETLNMYEATKTGWETLQQRYQW